MMISNLIFGYETGTLQRKKANWNERKNPVQCEKIFEFFD